MIVSATKTDKLARTRVGAALRDIEADLGLARGEIVPFSAVEGTGADALWARLAAVTAPDAARSAGAD